jgi:hypothetical protein
MSVLCWRSDVVEERGSLAFGKRVASYSVAGTSAFSSAARRVAFWSWMSGFF